MQMVSSKILPISVWLCTTFCRRFSDRSRIMRHAYKNDYFLIKSFIYFNIVIFCSAKLILVIFSFRSLETAVILINATTE